MSIYSCNECQDIAFRTLSKKLQDKFLVTRQESLDLLDYFMHCGYISPEFHQPVLDFIKRLEEFNNVRDKRTGSSENS